MPNWYDRANTQATQQGGSVDANDSNQNGTPMPQQSANDVAQQLSVKLQESAQLMEELAKLGGKDFSSWIKQLTQMSRNALFTAGL